MVKFKIFQIQSMSSDADDLLSYQEGTKAAGNKLVRKFIAKSGKAVEKLKDPQTAETFHTNVSKDETKLAYIAGTRDLTKSDLDEPMKERGKTNYLTSTGSKTAQDKWLKNGKDYRDEAKRFSDEKKPILTDQDADDNMLENARRMRELHRRKIGAA